MLKVAEILYILNWQIVSRLPERLFVLLVNSLKNHILLILYHISISMQNKIKNLIFSLGFLLIPGITTANLQSSDPIEQAIFPEIKTKLEQSYLYPHMLPT